MSTADLTALLGDVVDDADVRSRLLPLRGKDFANALIAVAAERGLTVEPHDVEAAVREARRTRWERWV